jgi:hypothetical protein
MGGSIRLEWVAALNRNTQLMGFILKPQGKVGSGSSSIISSLQADIPHPSQRKNDLNYEQPITRIGHRH